MIKKRFGCQHYISKPVALGFAGDLDYLVKENCFMRMRLDLRAKYGRNYRILSVSQEIIPMRAEEERYWMWKLMKERFSKFREHVELLDVSIIYSLNAIVLTNNA